MGRRGNQRGLGRQRLLGLTFREPDREAKGQGYGTPDQSLRVPLEIHNQVVL